MIRRPKQDECETIFLDRKWAKEKIPHFTGVISNVSNTEGIEITLTCNLDAFKFAIKYLEAEHDADLLKEVMEENVTLSNCLSLMVTCEFLQLRYVTQHISRKKFVPRFVDIINSCKLNLNSLNPKILKDIAQDVTFLQII